MMRFTDNELEQTVGSDQIEIGVCGPTCTATGLAKDPAANKWANDPRSYHVSARPPEYVSLGVSDTNRIANCMFRQRLGLCMPQVELIELKEGDKL